MPKAMVPMDGPQNGLCAVEHGIGLIKDHELSPRSGYRARPRVSRLRPSNFSRNPTLTSALGAIGPRLVAPEDEASIKPADLCGQKSAGKATTDNNSRYAPNLMPWRIRSAANPHPCAPAK